jgi:hypothetical protein
VSTVGPRKRHVVAAAPCEQCALPVLRGRFSGFCSVQCARRSAAKARAEQGTAFRSTQPAAAFRASIGAPTIA